MHFKPDLVLCLIMWMMLISKHGTRYALLCFYTEFQSWERHKEAGLQCSHPALDGLNHWQTNVSSNKITARPFPHLLDCDWPHLSWQAAILFNHTHGIFGPTQNWPFVAYYSSEKNFKLFKPFWAGAWKTRGSRVEERKK